MLYSKVIPIDFYIKHDVYFSYHLSITDRTVTTGAPAMTTTTKRQIRNVNAFVGKLIDFSKWVVPAGYSCCEMTGKLFAEKDAVSFQHWMFNRDFLKANGIYVEDAAWLSPEGYDAIMDTLDRLNVLDAFYEGWDHEQDFINGCCEIGASGLVWEAQPALLAA